MLINRICHYDDQHALRELIDYFYPRLYRITFAILKNKMLSEEVIGDVFFIFWQMRKRTPEIRDLNKYLCTSAKNNALVLLKKENRRNYGSRASTDQIFEFQKEIPLLSISPEKQYLTEELNRHIKAAISNLPERCKMVFELVKLEGLSYREAAIKLSIKPKTVENQLAIALKKMHEELKPYLQDQNEYSFEKTITLFLFYAVTSI